MIKPIKIGDGKVSPLEAIFYIVLGAIIYIVSQIAVKKGYDSYKAKNYTAEQIYVQTMVDMHNLRRYWDGRSYGTLWDYCQATVTADHVIAISIDDGESYVGKTPQRSGGLADVAHFGTWMCETPEKFDEGDPVSIIGYPGGSAEPSIRKGQVHFKRSVSGSAGYETPTWIIVFDTPEPVIGGMSGGIVLNQDDKAIGVLVVQNSAADLNGDGELQHSADVVSLYDYHLIAIENE